MTDRIEIRESGRGDWRMIEALYPAAFPDEDLLPLVRALLQDTSGTLSLAGIVGSSLAGHVLFTPCAVTGCHDEVALLGPLAVLPRRQRQGIGSALVGAGLRRLEHAGVTWVYVLGDPAYYGRLGFVHEAHVEPPYALPAEWRLAWQSIGLGAGPPPRRSPLQGKLCVPAAWLQPALWTS